MSSERVSNWNWANAFTSLRVFLVPVFAWLLLFREPRAPVLAAVIFMLAAATDGLDGYVARRLDQVTGFGQFLDPLADKLLVGTALAALAMDDRMPWIAVVIILGREVAVSVLRVVLARRGTALPASVWGKAKTIVQVVAVVVLTVLARGSVVAAAVLWLAVVVTVISGFQYFVEARSGRAGVPWN